jgi:hypothetical protein
METAVRNNLPLPSFARAPWRVAQHAASPDCHYPKLQQQNGHKEDDLTHPAQQTQKLQIVLQQ